MYPPYDLSSHKVILPGSHLSQFPRPDLPLGNSFQVSARLSFTYATDPEKLMV